MRTRLLGLAGLVVSLGVLVAAMALAPLALSRAVVPPGHAAAAVEAADPQPLGDFSDEGVRRFPIIIPGGTLDAEFPDRTGLDDTWRVDEVVRALLAKLGMPDALDDYALHDAFKAEVDALRAARQDPDDPFGLGPVPYPYSYPSVEDYVRPHVQQADPTDIVDLASLLLVHPDFGATGCYEFCSLNPEALAYTLLHVLAETSATCESQLTLAYLVSLGEDAPLTGVRAEAAKAQQLCVDDPTPQWLVAVTAARQASVVGEFNEWSFNTTELISQAEAAFAGLREAFPDSPLGWAGAADLYLDLAEDADRYHVSPFQVRSWRQQAVDLYAEARSRSGNPALLAGHARALSGVGRHDEAARLIAELVDRAPTVSLYQVLQTRILGAGLMHAELIEARDASQLAELPDRGTLDLGNPWGLGTQGWSPRTPYDPAYFEAGGAGTVDESFLPALGNALDYGGCVGTAQIAALIASGHADRAAQLAQDPTFADAFGDVIDCYGRPADLDYSLNTRNQELLLIALDEAGDVETRNAHLAENVSAESEDPEGDLDELLGEHLAARTAFWWAVGEADKVRDTVDEWLEELPDDPIAHERAGELAYVEGDRDEALDAFTAALEHMDDLDAEARFETHGSDFADVTDLRQQLLLQRGKTSESMGDTEAARGDYAMVEELGAAAEHSQWMGQGYAQLGALSLQEDRFAQAVGELQKALELYALRDAALDIEHERFPSDSSLVRGSEHNNLALAAARSGDFATAVEAAAEAVSRDPESPIFLDTMAFVHHLSGDSAAAAEQYREAIGEDSTSYVSANNLAVLLAEDGDREAAISTLRKAIAANPAYAKAWHNLGVVLTRGGSPADYLTGQGALARGNRLDHDLRGNMDGLVVDEEIYASGVDVSKAVAPEWSYASTASSTGQSLLFTLVLLVLVRVVWVLGLDRIGSWAAERVVASAPRAQRLNWLWRRFPAWVALLASMAILAIPIMWGMPLVAALVIVLVVGAVTLLPIVTRLLVAKESELGHFGWAPALTVGLLGIPFGVSVAPYPALDQHSVRWSVRWLPAIVLGGLTCILAVGSVTTDVPYLRVATGVSLALLATMLLPVRPFDGEHLKGRVAQTAVAVGLGVATVLVGLNWI